MSFQLHETYSKYKRRREAQYQCSQCGRSYCQKQHLGRHRTYECGKEPLFQCPYCGHRTKQRGNLYQHIKKRHETEPVEFVTQ